MTAKRMLASVALLAAATAARGELLTYTFDDLSWQGWSYVNALGEAYPIDDPDNGVGWEVSDADVDLDENGWFLLQGTSVNGIGETGNPQRIPNPRVIPKPWANRDCLGGLECQTEVLRSPIFTIDTLAPISIDMMGGTGNAPQFGTPYDPTELTELKGPSGYQGFALYDVEGDYYVEWGYPSFNNDGKERDARDVWETVTIPEEYMQNYVGDGREYRLDVFDSYSGGWGWIGFDTIKMPIDTDDFVYEWTSASGSSDWDNAGNWNDSWEDDAYFDVPIGGEVYINAPAAGEGSGPVISEGMSAKAGVLISAAGEAYMSMTGGELELNGWGMWWGDDAGATATFDMSGGLINFVGDPGIMEMAWQPDDAPAGSSVGVWNMTGGVVNAKGADLPGDGEDGNPGTAIVNLHGGTINIGTARGGLMMYQGGSIDLQGFGKLVLEGEQPQVDDYIASGWLTAFGGALELSKSFDADANETVITAMNVTGDYSGDGLVDLVDFNMLKEDFGGSDAGFAPGSSNADGVADLLDFNDLKANFGASVTGAVPEPGGLVLMAAGGLVALGLIRRK